MQLEKIWEQFGVKIIAQKEVKKGIINSTKIVTDEKGKRYVLQEINSAVFKNIDSLMDNISKVSEYIHEKHKTQKGSIDTVKLLIAGGKFYVTQKDEVGKNHYYRMYKFISGTSTYDEANEKLLYQAGIGFGNFQKLLKDFPVESLSETICNFHNTPYRFAQLQESISRAQVSNPERLSRAYQAIQYANKNEQLGGIIMNAMSEGTVPIRVVHNDTKLNNVALSDITHEVVAVLDLDTVMPGSLLFDYGDAIRYCASTVAEDETNLELVDVDFKKLKAFTKGYLQETKEILTNSEVELMSFSPCVLSYELGVRFLTDYLDGDKYFKVNSSRADHNLERAMAQFTLSKQFMAHQSEIDKIIKSQYAKTLRVNKKPFEVDEIEKF